MEKRQILSRFATVLSLGILFSLGLALATEPSLLSVEDARCRANLGKGVQRQMAVTAAQKARCFKLAMRGKLESTADCHDPGTWVGTRMEAGAIAIDRSLSLSRKLAEKGCSDASSPDLLGYSLCPAPCEAPIGESYDDVVGCLGCVTASCLGDVVRSAYGSPRTLSFPEEKPVFRCQNVLGVAIRVYLRLVVRAQQRCQLMQDREKEAFLGADCGNLADPAHPFASTFQKARERLFKLVDKCVSRYGVDIGSQLDTCGTDPETLAACLETVSDACAQAMFAANYPTPAIGAESVGAAAPAR
ncbi:MAG: hypothetical protein KatS3mg076_1759 [Candidatus Binatia bacterium]|nr:MAG: hypothetical protein KatS3mg076_1759 [Candidatus Binatia bacterium]